MLRVLWLALSIVLFPGPGRTDPIGDLLTNAHAGDFAAVTDAIRNTPDRKAQRDLMWALAMSDPETQAFTEKWVAAKGDDAAALAARAWSLYWASARVRGERTVRYTAPVILEEAHALMEEAQTLARRAVALDPAFLPASDAVILISTYLGAQDAAVAELERIMALDPNHHSLILAASALTPSWGGSTELMQTMCDYFAGNLNDAPGFDPQSCMAQAVLRGGVWGDLWLDAINRLSAQAENPLFERELLDLARSGELVPFPGAVEILRARLAAEGRMSTAVLLAGNPALLQLGPMPDRDGFAAALAMDIESAQREADRDPGSITPLQQLEELYRLELDFLGLQVLRKENMTEDDIAEYKARMGELAQRQSQDMDQRARRLVSLSPKSTGALQFAVRHLQTADADTLSADRWAIAALINAALYANYQDVHLGLVVTELRQRYSRMMERVERGELAAPGAAVIDDVYLCPYIRALRLVEALCEGEGAEDCFLNTIQRSRSERESYPLFAEVEGRNACIVEREGSIETLLYEVQSIETLP